MKNPALPKNVKKINEFKEKFKKYELRKILYDIAIEKREAKIEEEIQKAIKILLLGWNWRAYAVTHITNKEFTDQIKKFIESNRGMLYFLENKNKTLKNISFEEPVKGRIIKDWIKEEFDKLCKEKAIGPTGASKIFHMFFPKVFMMWDEKIKNKYHKANHSRRHKKGSGKCYFAFLEETQKFIREYRNAEIFRKENPVKVMDEYNYSRHTLENQNE